MIKWWADEQRNYLRKELFDKEGEKAEAKRINSWGNLSISQLRKYYSEIKNLENRFLNLSEGDPKKMEERWKEIHPLLVMVKAKLSYDRGRKDSGVTDGFKKYMEDCINSVKDYKDFEAFTKFFEACVGYYYEKQAQPQNQQHGQNQEQRNKNSQSRQH